jgi:cbb3-type cytochrome oxidase subunit 1
MKASTFSFRTATVMALVGIGMGIGMAASHDHSLMPVHAHLNLLGWVSLFLFGIYYKLNPNTDASRLATIQAGTWAVGTVVLAAAVTALHLGHAGAEPIAAIGSLILLAGMLLFTLLVFRPVAADRVTPAAVMTPAE